jgi:hypothetical protein
MQLIIYNFSSEINAFGESSKMISWVLIYLYCGRKFEEEDEESQNLLNQREVKTYYGSEETRKT